jgi:hypothetical protein
VRLAYPALLEFIELSLVVDLLFVRHFSHCILIVLADDITKLWRCYVIWGKRKDIVVLPGALVAATTGEYFTPHLCACIDTPLALKRYRSVIV